MSSGISRAAPRPDAGVETWLAWLESVSGPRIDLGLDRVRNVVDRLALWDGTPPLIATVAGTNGKGTVVHAVDALLRATSTLSVGRYTSPHVFDFRERIVIDGTVVDDARLQAAFERVAQAMDAALESASIEAPLTYFEFTTLAAMACFESAGVDVVVLEVGLGGRLDAVNVWDPDVTAVTSIALDHEAFLGSTLDAIAREKAGIARVDVPCWVAEVDGPPALLQALSDRGARIRAPASFDWFLSPGSKRDGSAIAWRWVRPDGVRCVIPVTLTKARAEGLPLSPSDHDLPKQVGRSCGTFDRSLVRHDFVVDEVDVSGRSRCSKSSHFDGLVRDSDRQPETLERAIWLELQGARGRNLAVAVGVVCDLLALMRGTVSTQSLERSGSSAVQSPSLKAIPVEALWTRPPGRFERMLIRFRRETFDRESISSDAPVSTDGLKISGVGVIRLSDIRLERAGGIKPLIENGPSLDNEPSLDETRRSEVVTRLVVFDVAHNPAAVAELLRMLDREAIEPEDVVFGAMADKDLVAIFSQCASHPALSRARWWLGRPNVARAASFAVLVAKAGDAGLQRLFELDSLSNWCGVVLRASSSTAPILVFGSFFTVAEGATCAPGNGGGFWVHRSA
ncbi:MAG: bifunctional folylpolyglutamate synthase/dihydrofolate synthase [Thioalkalivibrionaceae bacterium]